jgi:hypothetical protein
MDQQRLSDIWNKLQAGDRVLGWTCEIRDVSQLLIPANGAKVWCRNSPDENWTPIERDH